MELSFGCVAFSCEPLRKEKKQQSCVSEIALSTISGNAGDRWSAGTLSVRSEVSQSSVSDFVQIIMYLLGAWGFHTPCGGLLNLVL